MRTVSDVVASLPEVGVARLEAAGYSPPAGAGSRPRVGLAVEDMRRHMTDEGWQVFAGLDAAGYHLAGHNLSPHYLANDPYAGTNVDEILSRFNPSTVVVQDKREWDVAPRDFREPRARFLGVGRLRGRPDIFKLTILKDAQARPAYHRESAEEMGVHAWVVYYAPAVVLRLAPYLRAEHLIRTHHSLDPAAVPPFDAYERGGCVLSGATGGAYPLRSRLVAEVRRLPWTTLVPFPGYHRGGSATPAYLDLLSRFKVAICTSSRYGYLLRKIIEATAAGCVVITDLPADEIVPGIDTNLVRIHPEYSTAEVGAVIRRAMGGWDADRQSGLAAVARAYFDYRAVGMRLAEDIERLRRSYPLAAGPLPGTNPRPEPSTRTP